MAALGTERKVVQNPLVRYARETGWEWRCPLCQARRGGYESESKTRDGLPEHNYRAGH